MPACSASSSVGPNVWRALEAQRTPRTIASPRSASCPRERMTSTKGEASARLADAVVGGVADSRVTEVGNERSGVGATSISGILSRHFFELLRLRSLCDELCAQSRTPFFEASGDASPLEIAGHHFDGARMKASRPRLREAQLRRGLFERDVVEIVPL